MLRCKDVAARASALIDGDISAWDALQIRVHLAMCKGCTRFVEQMRLTDQFTAEVSELERRHRRDAEDGRIAEMLSILHQGSRRR